MITVFLLMIVLTGTVFTAQAMDRLVVRDAAEFPGKWERKPICGHDFFPVLNNVYWAAPGAKDAPEGFSVYRECGWRAEGRCPKGVKYLRNATKQSASDGILGRKPKENRGYAEMVPTNELRTTPYRLYDMFEGRFGKKVADRLYTDADNHRPIMLMCDERPAFRLQEKFPLADRADYAAWLKAHPNCFGCYSLLEFDSDLQYYFIGFSKTTDPEAFRELQRSYPCTFWDYACDTDLEYAWLKTALKRSEEYYFGDKRLWCFSAGSPGMIPQFAAAGAAGVCYEATTQGMTGNWRFAAPFLRGAARQFGMDYGWYTASFYDGFYRDDRREKPTAGENSLVGKDPSYPFFGLNRGASFELIDRQNVYGWLIGARYTEVENWSRYHREKLADGSFVPTRAAKDFQRLYDLSKRYDRGQCVAPLALLMPINDKVGRGGGNQNFTSLRQTAALYTLVPGDSGPDPLRRRGVEGGFYNSEFADFFDVVTPDASKDGRVYEALKPYPAAAMFGRYRNWAFAYPDVRRYVVDGGTLFVSCDYLDDQLIDAAMTGVKFPGPRYALSGDELVDDRGNRSKLVEQYNLRLGAATTAKVLWTDSNGTPVAYVNDLGKGRIITITAEGMMPIGWDQTWGIRNARYSNSQVGKIRRGEVKFTIMREIFRRVQAETLPFRVEGDIMWGVNGRMNNEECIMNNCGGSSSNPNNQTTQQPKHPNTSYLLWFFNNKGITNYLDEAPIVDHSCDARIVVTGVPGIAVGSVREIGSDRPVALVGNGFEATVPAGGWLAFEVRGE